MKIDLAYTFLAFLIKSSTELYHQSSLNACYMNGWVTKITTGNEDPWLEYPSVKNGTTQKYIVNHTLENTKNNSIFLV